MLKFFEELNTLRRQIDNPYSPGSQQLMRSFAEKFTQVDPSLWDINDLFPKEPEPDPLDINTLIAYNKKLFERCQKALEIVKNYGESLQIVNIKYEAIARLTIADQIKIPEIKQNIEKIVCQLKNFNLKLEHTKKTAYKAINQLLTKQMEIEPNTIAVRIWYRKEAHERTESFGQVDDGHMSVTICNSKGEQRHISLYPLSNSPALEPAAPALAWLAKQVHMPKPDTKPGFFMSSKEESVMLHDGSYKECKSVTLTGKHVNINAAWTEADGLLKKYKSSDDDSKQPYSYDFYWDSCGTMGLRIVEKALDPKQFPFKHHPTGVVSPQNVFDYVQRIASNASETQQYVDSEDPIIKQLEAIQEQIKTILEVDETIKAARLQQESEVSLDKIPNDLDKIIRELSTAEPKKTYQRLSTVRETLENYKTELELAVSEIEALNINSEDNLNALKKILLIESAELITDINKKVKIHLINLQQNIDSITAIIINLNRVIGQFSNPSAEFLNELEKTTLAKITQLVPNFAPVDDTEEILSGSDSDTPGENKIVLIKDKKPDPTTTTQIMIAKALTTTAQDPQAALMEQSLKVNDVIHQLSVKYLDACKKPKETPDELRNFYKNSRNALRQHYGKLQQYLYFDRDLNTSSQNNTTALNSLITIFDSSNSRKLSVRDGVETFPEVICNCKTTFKTDADAYSEEARNKGWFAWSERTLAKTEKEIHSLLSDDTLSSKQKLKSIRQLVDNQQPAWFAFWRTDKRSQYQEMLAKASLICLLEDFTQGNVDMMGFALEIKSLAQTYKELGIGQAFTQFAQQCDATYKAAAASYKKEFGGFRRLQHDFTNKLSSYADMLEAGFGINKQGKLLNGETYQPVYDEIQEALRALNTPTISLETSKVILNNSIELDEIIEIEQSVRTRLKV